jgi:hypothetical protein
MEIDVVPSASRASHKNFISYEFLRHRTTIEDNEEEEGRKKTRAGNNFTINHMPATRVGMDYTWEL